MAADHRSKFCTRSCLSKYRYANETPKDAERRRSSTRDFHAKRRKRIGAQPVGSGYRSGMELRLAPEILAAGGKYELIRLDYAPKPRRYTPDFILPNGIAIEVKGYWNSADRTKLLDVKQSYPDLDLRLVLAEPCRYLTAVKRMTQSEWCESHGFGWSDNVVPKSWYTEPVNLNSKAVIDAAWHKKGEA